MLQQGRIAQPSITFLQAFESILEGKCTMYSHDLLDGLTNAITAMIRIYKITKSSRDGAMVSKDIILTLMECLLAELQHLIGEDEDCVLTMS